MSGKEETAKKEINENLSEMSSNVDGWNWGGEFDLPSKEEIMDDMIEFNGMTAFFNSPHYPVLEKAIFDALEPYEMKAPVDNPPYSPKYPLISENIVISANNRQKTQDETTFEIEAVKKNILQELPLLEQARRAVREDINSERLQKGIKMSQHSSPKVTELVAFFEHKQRLLGLKPNNDNRTNSNNNDVNSSHGRPQSF
ncbi:MAG: hypothetical protein K2Q14_02585 [Gammaproteobacteria bacterium]|nr:hypothetical protein [Gammaproteobacteria bacterium]